MKKKSDNFLLFLGAGLFILIFSVLISKGKVLGLFDRDVEIILTGDVMLGRTVMTKSLDLGDPTYPFRKVGDSLKSADLVFINLENPIVSHCPSKFDGLIFCADPKMVEGLSFAGIDIVTLANNHTLNYGNKGFEETKKVLADNGISYVEAGNLVIKVVNGIKFGFLGFDFTSKAPTDADYSLVRDSDKKVDVLVIGVHWGAEYQGRASGSQREWARRLVEAGADVIAGHHPHWVQDMEKINGKPVYYSLGNFVFDQMWSQETREGIIVRLTFRGNQLTNQQINKIYMSSWSQPEFVK